MVDRFMQSREEELIFFFSNGKHLILQILVVSEESFVRGLQLEQKIFDQTCKSVINMG